MISIKSGILLIAFLHSAMGQASKFNLYTRNNSSSPQRIVAGNLTTLQLSNFNYTDKTWFFIHGWKAKPDDHIKDAILNARNVNVILVDWSTISNYDYISARKWVPVIGGELSTLLLFLQDNKYALNKIHIIGFSLGAHVAGMSTKTISGGFPGSITGVDPPFVLFDYKDPTTRLALSDAAYVEVIHGSILGFHEALGHVDFYLNVGYFQPGCSVDIFSDCSHLKILFAYIKAMNDTATGWKCSNQFNCEYGLFLSKSKSCTWGGDVPKTCSGTYSVMYDV